MDVRKGDHLYIAGRGINWYNHSENPLKKLKANLPQDPAILPSLHLGIHPIYSYKTPTLLWMPTSAG